MASYEYYCPICGELQLPRIGLVQCVHCFQKVYLRQTIRDWEYYRQKAEEQNDGSETFRETIQKIVIAEEASKSPEYRPEMRNYKPTKDEIEKRDERILQMMIKNNQQHQEKNAPKCPTCGSLNIEKITVGSKVVGAAIFGLFSKTARSQFRCKNCGYKW